jgi:hypothetical protein
MIRSLIAKLIAVTALVAQSPPQQTQQAPQPQAAAPAAVVLENDGKPITLPFHCTAEDIHWAGLACSEDEPCPIYLELSAIGSGGGGIFAAGNIHSDTVTLYSVLLATEDAGHTWREAGDRVRGAALDHIQFFDALTGWISGQTVFPIPQDPFFLLTTDGGKTWRQQPVFNDSHFGSIQQFYFDSKTSGYLIIDQGPGADGGRYARFESPTGGETWSIREESNKPLQLSRTAAPPPNLRIRADGATHAFRIERRQGERWSTLASFAVRLPACKPE